jgi:oligopeptide transport system substrate-binding protein
VSADGKRYRFKLRDGARWSDGRPVTAADFEFAWKRNLLPSTEAPAAQLLYVIEGAEAFHKGDIDDADLVGVHATSRLELDVTLRAPTAYFPYLLAHPVTFPQPWWLIQVEGRRWTHPQYFVGNGPYVLAERVERERLRLVKNEEFTGRFPGNAVDIDCRIYRSYAESFAAYQRGELDVLDLISAPLDVIRSARAQFTREVNEFPLLSTSFVVLRADRAPFNDARVRRAFAHAVDRKALTHALSGGEHVVALGGFIPQGVPGHASEVVPAFDPVRARELLAEAGFSSPVPGGVVGAGAAHASLQPMPPLVWLHSHGVGDRSVVDAVAQTWRDVLGVTIEVKVVRYEELERALHDHPPDIVLGAWIADYPDPDSFLRATFHVSEGHENTGWSNARYDTHVEKAARTTRVDERIELYKLADRILVAEEAGVIPVSYGKNLVLIKPQIAYFPRSTSYLRALRDVLVARSIVN